MGNYHRGQVGVGYYRKWLQNRIHLQPTLRGRRKANTDTHGPRPKIGSRGGDCGPAGQAGSYRGAGGDGTPLPVVLLSHTKTGRNLASHLKPQTPQPKVCQAKRFRMENLHVVLPLLRKGMWAATVDLKDAYLHIPMHREHRRYVAFHYDGRDYLFRSLPFGLSTARGYSPE
ncbi:putative TBC1 domain family member 2A [Apostichopus japonicus]|uniref:Putative TBC1 domain family member 2A n=1 Tax=Stichopus japonicus TaxID=307972 RepID=A0A2G8K4I2_STIJA|nr:putative TBC1 domain family member 2A [Apostichopus japonicus]